MNIKILNNRKNKGFGLVEIMIALIIVGSIVAAVLWKSMDAMRSSADNKAIDMVADIILKTKTLFPSGTHLVDMNVIGEQFPISQRVGNNPINRLKGPHSGSEITLSPQDCTGGNNSDNRYFIALSNIPQKSCMKLVTLLNETDGIRNITTVNAAGNAVGVKLPNAAACPLGLSKIEFMVSS